MARDAVILKVLSNACQDDLQFFDSCSISFAEQAVQQCFVCVGKHHLHFVATDFQDVLGGCSRLSYLHINRAILDVSTHSLFVLELDPDSLLEEAPEVGQRVLVESQQRQQLVELLARCWQAERMLQHFEAERFPCSKADIAGQLGLARLCQEENLRTLPFKGYEDCFDHGGYSVWLKSGFCRRPGGDPGRFMHPHGWQVTLKDGSKVSVPADIEVTLHVATAVECQELEASLDGQDDLKTVAQAYLSELLPGLDQFYIMVNNEYLKKMNRTGDVSSWSCWEVFIRGKDHIYGCILSRREFIPPLCDITQDITVLLRCPATELNFASCEVLLAECRAIADSLSPSGHCRDVDTRIIQARLDSLQCTNEGFFWFHGRLRLTPVHRHPAAVKFVKSVVKLLHDLGVQEATAPLDDPIFAGIPVLHDPLVVAQEMLSDAEPLLGDVSKDEREERRSAWYQRIAKYLAVCIDGGLLGDRFTLVTLVGAILSAETRPSAVLRKVVEFLLHLLPKGSPGQMWSHSSVSLVELLHDPALFGHYHFSRTVLHVLVTEHYIEREWHHVLRRRCQHLDTEHHQHGGGTLHQRPSHQRTAAGALGAAKECEVGEQDLKDDKQDDDDNSDDESDDDEDEDLDDEQEDDESQDHGLWWFQRRGSGGGDGGGGGGGASSSSSSLPSKLPPYEGLLAALLTNHSLGLALRTTICRQILGRCTQQADFAAGSSSSSSSDKKQVARSSLSHQRKAKMLVPALLKAAKDPNLTLASCAVAAMVNLTSNQDATKDLAMQSGVLDACMGNLRRKDDDLARYTLLLLVNLTKLPHHRLLVVGAGAVPILVDLLTSSYQNRRKHQVLMEVASVLGHLCNDVETRTILAKEYPVIPCLLWMNDHSQPNTALKAKLLFALRQLAFGSNRAKIAEHSMSSILEQVSAARPRHSDCLSQALLLLRSLASGADSRRTLLLMSQEDRLEDALRTCGLQKDGKENAQHPFGSDPWQHAQYLKDRFREEFI